MEEKLDSHDEELKSCKLNLQDLKTKQNAVSKDRADCLRVIRESKIPKLVEDSQKAHIVYVEKVENVGQYVKMIGGGEPETEHVLEFAKCHRDFNLKPNRATVMERGKEIIRLATRVSDFDDSESQKFTKAYFEAKLNSRLVPIQMTVNDLCIKKASGTFIIMLHGQNEEQEIELIMWQPETSVFTAMTPADKAPSVWKLPPLTFQKIVIGEPSNLLAELFANLHIPGAADNNSAVCYELKKLN